MSADYIAVGNQLVLAKEYHIGLTNRAFRYGDSVFESIRIANGQPVFIDDHFERFTQACVILQLTLPKWLNVSSLEKIILELAAKNNTPKAARVRLTAYRTNGLTYRPDANDAEILVETYPLDDETYTLSDKGLTIGVYKAERKVVTSYSQFKTGNSLLYVLAGVYANVHKFDEVLILNPDDRVVEAISSNIFVVKNGQLFTPPLGDGCINGVMRRNIIEIAEEGGYKVNEKSFTVSFVEDADEVFLTNTIKGIVWVGALGKRRYFNNLSKELLGWLAESVE